MRLASRRCKAGLGASMPFPLQALILWLHLLAVMTWIGGLVFQVLVVFPTLAWAAPTGERLRFALSLEARFRVILWPAVGLVLFTGLVNLINISYAVFCLKKQDMTWRR